MPDHKIARGIRSNDQPFQAVRCFITLFWCDLLLTGILWQIINISNHKERCKKLSWRSGRSQLSFESAALITDTQTREPHTNGTPTNCAAADEMTQQSRNRICVDFQAGKKEGFGIVFLCKKKKDFLDSSMKEKIHHSAVAYNEGLLGWVRTSTLWQCCVNLRSTSSFPALSTCLPPPNESLLFLQSSVFSSKDSQSSFFFWFSGARSLH